MIIPDQLQAQVDADPPPTGPEPLNNSEIMLLENIVKRYPVYAGAAGLFPDLHAQLLAVQAQDEDATPQYAERTYFLRAVLAALNELPEVNAESSGTDKSQSYFSTSTNWNELAQDILSLFYNMAAVLGAAGQRNYVLVQRTIQDLLLHDSLVLKMDKTGRRF